MDKRKDFQLKCKWPLLRVAVNTKQALHGGNIYAKAASIITSRFSKYFTRKESLAVLVMMFIDWILGITLAF